MCRAGKASLETQHDTFVEQNKIVAVPGRTDKEKRSAAAGVLGATHTQHAQSQQFGRVARGWLREFVAGAIVQWHRQHTHAHTQAHTVSNTLYALSLPLTRTHTHAHARFPCTPPGSACGASWTQVASLTLAPLHAGAIHYQLPDGSSCDPDTKGAIKRTTGGHAAKGALPSVQAPPTYAD